MVENEKTLLYLEGILSNFKNKKILVLGDVMLDAYIDVKPNGFNPESGAPNLTMGEERYSAGGAGNVAQNIRELGAFPYLLGVIGNDVNADKLADILNEDFRTDEQAIGEFFFLHDSSRPTTTKTRLVEQLPDGTHKHWARLNKEKTHLLSALLEKSVKTYLDENVLGKKEFDGIYLSDYNKGFLTEKIARYVIYAARERNIPVFVDPKPANMPIFRSATYVKINEKESDDLKRMLDDMKIYTSWNELYDVRTFIMTKGAKGVSILSKIGGKDEMIDMPAYARKVGDVVGAGDTFGAAFFLSALSGADMAQSAKIAAYAAAVAVEKTRTGTASSSEISQFMREYNK